MIARGILITYLAAVIGGLVWAIVVGVLGW
jgi:hypothetical protein